MEAWMHVLPNMIEELETNDNAADTVDEDSISDDGGDYHFVIHGVDGEVDGRNVEDMDSNSPVEMDTEVIDVEKFCDDINRMQVSRKVRSLSSALETIQRLQSVDQVKVLRKAMDQTNINCVETMIMSDVDSKKEADLLNGFFSHLQQYNLLVTNEKSRFCSLLWSVCGDDLFNDDYISWLAQKLGRRKCRLSQTIRSWLSVTTESLEARGRKGLSEEK